MGTLHILTDVIFVGSDIYQLMSAMRKKVFSYSNTGPAPAWLDSENYSSTFYLVILGEEIDCVRKMGNKRMHTESLKNHNMRDRRMRICSSLLKLRNKIF